jgi:hypothetical protein
MQKLHESIAHMLLNKIINENHNEVIKHLNSAAGSDIGGETPAFTHESGENKDGPSGSPKHSSPVKDHYYHQGQFATGGADEQHEHHITVSHHDDGTATVQHSAYRQKWSDRQQDYNVSDKHREKHFKDLPSAIAHVKTLKTPE